MTWQPAVPRRGCRRADRRDLVTCRRCLARTGDELCGNSANTGNSRVCDRGTGCTVRVGSRDLLVSVMPWGEAVADDAQLDEGARPCARPAGAESSPPLFPPYGRFGNRDRQPALRRRLCSTIFEGHAN
jgi:hypothetical protein